MALADAATMTEDEQNEMIAGMVQRLHDRLIEEPNDTDGWIRLARAYNVLGQAENALDALTNGAKVIVLEQEKLSPRGVVTFVVKDSRKALSFLMAAAWGDPQKKLPFVGITGTNGKTTTSLAAQSIFKSFGVKCGVIGTLGYHNGLCWKKTKHTTPDAEVLLQIISEMVDHKVDVVVMEVSSHSLVQGKVAPIVFSSAVFTSFSHDHLDFHGSEKKYFAAKWMLFERYLASGGVSILHESLLSRVPQDWLLTHKTWAYSVNKTELKTHKGVNFFRGNAFSPENFSPVSILSKEAFSG